MVSSDGFDLFWSVPAPERSEGAKGLRSPRRETPKVAPGAAEETGGFRGPRSKTNGKA